MTASGWIQLVLILGTITLLTKPLGIYLVRVLDPERQGGTFLDPILGPLERLVYRVLGIKAERRSGQSPRPQPGTGRSRSV
jgi:K+-transporting ATPase ATPase A chain